MTQFLVGLVLVIVVGVGGYFYGRHDGKQASLDELAALEAKYDQVVKDNADVQEKWKLSQEQVDEWKTSTALAAADARRVTDLLHQTRARRCPVPSPPGTSTDTRPSGGESAYIEALRTEVEGITGRYIEASGVDAIERDILWNRYNQLRDAQHGP